MVNFVPVSYSNGTPVLASGGSTRVACTHLAQWLQWYDALQVARGRGHISYYQTQGTSIGASAGTHACGSAWDMHYTGDDAIRDAHEMGAAQWHRIPGHDGWPSNGADHCHGLISCGDNSCNGYQYTAWKAGYNGLGNGYAARDRLSLPGVIRSWQQGIDWAKSQITPNPAPTPTPEEDDDMMPLFVRTIEAGNPIYALVPGQKVHHVTPDEWTLLVDRGATLKGHDVNRLQVDMINGVIGGVWSA